MQVFIGTRVPGGRNRVVVREGVIERELPHLMLHSPDGFEWGYHGSGPLDLARALVAFLMGTRVPSARIYRQVLREFVAHLEGDEWRATDQEVWFWVNKAKANS